MVYLRLILGLSFPIIIINVFGSIVSAIWLAVIGEWGLTGFVIILLSTFIISIALMPSMIFTMPSLYFLEKGLKFPGYFFGFLNLFYSVVVVILW